MTLAATEGRSPGGGLRTVLLAGLGYLVAALVLTYPLVVSPRTTIELGWGDPVLYVYLLAWGQHALLTDPLHVFDASFLFPTPNALSLSDHYLAVSWPLVPLAALGDPLLAHNLATLIGLVASGLGSFLLLRRLSVSPGVAWASGLLFAFLPWRLGQVGHPQLLQTGWLPLALVAFEAWRERPAAGRSAAFGAIAGSTFLASAYHGYAFFLFLAVYVPARLRKRPGSGEAGAGRRLSLHGLLATAGAGVVLAPSLLAYRAMKAELGEVNPLGLLARRGADLLDYLNPSSLSLVWGRFGQEGHPYSDVPWEMHAFPGVLPLCALAAGIVVALRGLTRRDGTGPRGGPVTAFTLAGLFLALVSLGPVVHAAGHRLPVPGPYELLYRLLPGFSALRVPARASFFVGLAGAALFGLLLESLRARTTGPVRHAVVVGGCALVLLDVWPHPLPYLRATEYLRLRSAMAATASRAARGADVVLPLDRRLNYAAPAASAGAFRPLLNGVSGYLPPSNGRAFDLLAQRGWGAEQALLLRRLGVTRVLLDRRLLASEPRDRIVRQLLAHAREVTSFDPIEDVEVLLVRWD